jgi:hypothetical protein
MSQQRYFFGVCVAILTVFSGFKAGATEPRPIDGFDDNSFLVEEAYNQDRGEVQHTLNAVYSNDLKRRGWSFNFEQEWWLFTEDHQVAFSVPFSHLREEGERQRGVGDIQIEYRYQLTEEGPNIPAVAPGFSLILPTGNRDKGTGNGVVGYEWSIAASKKVVSRLALHANLGLTYLPKVRVPLDDDQRLSPKRSLVSYDIGASAVFALVVLAVRKKLSFPHLIAMKAWRAVVSCATATTAFHRTFTCWLSHSNRCHRLQKIAI